MSAPDREVITIVQARMSSSRLPGKVLEDIGGRPLLELLLARLASSFEAPLVVATSRSSEDDAIADWCEGHGVDVVREGLCDVLSRFVAVVNEFDVDVVVRLTGDNPLVTGPALQTALLSFHKLRRSANIVGVSNHLEDRTDPYGFAVEVVVADELRRLDESMLSARDREHVTLPLRREGRLGPVHLLDGDHRSLRWTVDYPEDLEYIRKMIESCGHLAPVQELVSWSQEHAHPLVKGSDGSVAEPRITTEE